VDERHRHELRFLDILQHEVGLVAVLRGHLYVEGAIEQLLLAEVPGSEVLLHRLPFFRKLKAAKKLGIVSAECANAAKALSEVRNGFAHDFGARGSERERTIAA